MKAINELDQAIILFRPCLGEDGEYEVCQQYFTTHTSRTSLPSNSLVIPRYSALPYYKEVEQDIINMGGTPINSYEQHRWIANFEWYDTELKNYTFRTWHDHEFYLAPKGPYVVKGKTNSKKMEWNKLMYAPSKTKAAIIGCELSSNEFIGPQGLIYREYVPLKTFEVGMNDLPFTEEWRFFYLGNSLLSYGYYWSIAENLSEIMSMARPLSRMMKFAQQVARIVSQHVNFFVLDIAQKESGDYILVEINDGMMSGLSENNPHCLYSNLGKELLIRGFTL